MWRIPVHFDIPTGLEEWGDETCNDGSRKYRRSTSWQLEVRGKVHGKWRECAFPVPVFKAREETPPAPGGNQVDMAALRYDFMNPANLALAGIQAESLPQGGMHLFFPNQFYSRDNTGGVIFILRWWLATAAFFISGAFLWGLGFVVCGLLFSIRAKNKMQLEYHVTFSQDGLILENTQFGKPRKIELAPVLSDN